MKKIIVLSLVAAFVFSPLALPAAYGNGFEYKNCSDLCTRIGDDFCAISAIGCPEGSEPVPEWGHGSCVSYCTSETYMSAVTDFCKGAVALDPDEYGKNVGQCIKMTRENIVNPPE